MEWIERFNSAINYIEENIKGTIDYDKISKIACCSTYHFQRMFSYMADVPLSEYIRLRKMSLAAVDLQTKNKKIIDLALEYGYSSPTAFNRAFQAFHGIAPSRAKEAGNSFKTYPPISFKIVIKGASVMDYRIEKTDSFRIVGPSISLYNEMEKNFKIVPKMWQNAFSDGTIPKLLSLMNGTPKGILGVSAYIENKPKYYIAVSSTKDIDNSFDELIVPASTWVIFSGSGNSEAIQNLEKRIMTEWFPTSGYEYANSPELEVYLNDDPINMKFEVWIPVVKK